MARPRISTNLAISADGKITSVGGCASGWTSGADHARLLALRRGAGAILVGKGTLEADRMTLTVPGAGRQPLRCVVSRRGGLDPSHLIFQAPGGDIHLLVTDGFEESAISKVKIHRQTLAEFLEMLASDYRVERIHCEGGGQLIRSLAALDAIDEFHLTLAGHTLFGGLNASTATGIPAEYLVKSLDFEISHFDPQPATGECFLSYVRCR